VIRPARLVALLIVLLAALVGPAQAGTRRVVMRDGLMYKPHELAVSGDGDFSVQALRWHSWGGRTAVATGQAVEQQRPSHVNHTYPTKVTLSHRTFCANLHRTVYNEVVAQILGPSPGVFGGRTLGRRYTCAGTWQLVSPPPGPTRPSRPSAATHKCSTHGIPRYVQAISAHGSTCARARTLVLAWSARRRAPGGNRCIWADGATHLGICTIRGWRCVAWHTVNGQTFPVTCTTDAGRRRIHFVNEV
jgi:hypothetical protein